MEESIFTEADIEELRNYLNEMEEVIEREPEQLPAEIWDKVWPQIQETGEIPEEYRDRIASKEVPAQDEKYHFLQSDRPFLGYYDLVWERWNEECNQIECKYQDVILKALHYILYEQKKEERKQKKGSNTPILDLLRALINSKSVTTEQVRAALPQLASLIPQKHIIANNKLANSLTKDIIDAGLIELDLGRKKGDIITRCVLTYEGDNVKLTSRQPFTEYDRQVADAVTSLYEYGNESHIITAATVYRAMVHATATETPSPQQIGAVTRSLDKMRFVRVQIDCSEELTRRNIDLNGAQITGGKIDTYLLTLKKLEVTAGGQKVAAYKIADTPILYDYSRLTGQVITVPAALLDIRDKDGAKVSNTERRIAIKGYLMRRISVMKGKNGKKQSRHIIYDSLFSEIGETDKLSRRDQQLIREYVGIVLDNWKRDSFIKGYKELTQGKKKIGIEVNV